MNITIVGAGNVGLAITSYIAINKKHQITLYTNKDVMKNGPLIMKDFEEHKEIKTDKFNVTSSKEEAFTNADIVLCTYPAFLKKQFIEQNSSYFKCGMKLGFIPGYGGVEYCCKDLIKKGVVIFGLQRVPYVARAHEEKDGIIAGILSKKSKIYSAAIPYSYTSEVCNLMQELLDIPCIALKEYLAITLAPSNPLLHISGIYNVFKDYKQGISYDKEMRFYEEWNDNTSELLLKYDDELQKICQNLKPLEMGEVVSLREYYESPTVTQMTKKLKSIESFKEVLVPMKKEGNNYFPDLKSRMFTEDFPFGICIIKSFAIITNIDTPTIDMLLKFHENLTGLCYFNEDGTLGKDSDQTGIPFNYGIKTKNDIISFYRL